MKQLNLSVRSLYVMLGLLVLLMTIIAPANAQNGTVVYTKTDCPYQDPYDSTANNLCRSVTLTRSMQGTIQAQVTLTRGKPNTTYYFYVNCQQIGSNLITDTQGNGRAIFDYFINWNAMPNFADMSSKISNVGNRCPQ